MSCLQALWSELLWWFLRQSIFPKYVVQVPDPIIWASYCHFAFKPSRGPNTTQKTQFLSFPVWSRCPSLLHMSQLSQHPRIPHPLPRLNVCNRAQGVPAFAHWTCAEQMRWERMMKAGKQREDLGLGTIFLFELVWGMCCISCLDILFFLS